jgi:RNA polymerase primary sigma factor
MSAPPSPRPAPPSLQELAKARMITSNLRLVVSIAKKYANRGVNIQDLIQEGSFGLITAVDKFDPLHKCRFSTYAHYWIKQSVTRALADFSRTIRLPVHMNDCVKSIRKTRTTFFCNEGRQPSDEELAASLRISQTKLRLAITSSRELISLEAACFVNTRPSEDKAWLDLIPDEAPKPEHFLETAMLQEQIHQSLLSALLPLEREVLCLRYGLEGRDRRSFEEIGHVFELPKERMRQLEARALRKLKRPQQHRNLIEFDAHKMYM